RRPGERAGDAALRTPAPLLHRCHDSPNPRCSPATEPAPGPPAIARPAGEEADGGTNRKALLIGKTRTPRRCIKDTTGCQTPFSVCVKRHGYLSQSLAQADGIGRGPAMKRGGCCFSTAFSIRCLG